MYTLITRITHSQGLKDALKVAIGVQRVLMSGRPEPQSTLKDYRNVPKQQDVKSQEISVVNTLNVENTHTQREDMKRQAIEPVESKIQAKPIHKVAQKQAQKKESPTEQDYVQDWEGDLSSLERQESKVVSSRLGRFFEYGKLGSQLLSTQAKTYLNRSFGSGSDQQIYEKGAEKITQELCRMRGAPLKVAQLLSIQEDTLIPGPIRQAFQKAREKAHLMPTREVETVMKKELGKAWMASFEDFEMKPFAAASIGQVHQGVTKQGQELAVKVQYPGVQQSIKSDISNLSMLLKIPGVLPKGIFIDKLLANTQNQLRNQCDYTREAQMQELYDRCLKDVMGEQYKRFAVPRINKRLSNRHILSSQLLKGIQVASLQKDDCPQSLRDQVGRLIVKLTFSEIFEMGIMQSDPNPSNFTYDLNRKRLNLFDFGATHIYAESFLRHYRQIINASVREDRQTMLEESVLAGFLTREENQVMLDQHHQSVLVLGDPLRHQGIYDFGSQRITERIYKTIPLMLRNRLKAPPHEVYSLHRKLSGAYLACIRMKSRVDCSRIYRQLKQGNRVQQLI